MAGIFYFTGMSFFIYNGKLFQNDAAIIGPGNRGLRYGDGLFETMLFKNGELVLANDHFHRLWKGLQALHFDIPALFTPEMLIEQINKLIRKNKNTTARIRLMVFRGHGGLYDPENHQPNYTIETWPLPATSGILNENGLQLCLYTDALKSIDLFSNLKHNNYLPYVMGALYAKEKKCNDAVIINQQQRICDTTIANIFLVTNQGIITPALSEGCVAGTRRKAIIHAGRNTGYNVLETSVTKDMLAEADEVFISNAVHPIRWVASLENKKYSNSFIMQLHAQLKQTIPELFC